MVQDAVGAVLAPPFSDATEPIKGGAWRLEHNGFFYGDVTGWLKATYHM